MKKPTMSVKCQRTLTNDERQEILKRLDGYEVVINEPGDDVLSLAKEIGRLARAIESNNEIITALITARAETDDDDFDDGPQYLNQV